MLLLISPFAPHIANEVFDVMGYGDVEKQAWPVADESALVLDEIEMPVQINGKMRGVVKVSPDITQDSLIEVVKSNEKICRYFDCKLECQ